MAVVQSAGKAGSGGGSASGSAGGATLVSSTGLAKAPLARPGGKLIADLVLDALVEDGLIVVEEAARIAQQIRLSSVEQQALTAIAARKPKSASPPHKTLNLDELTEWLAKRAGLPYAHIDPLRVDVSRIGETMSSAYAARFMILPIDVKPHEVVIATAEPYADAWVAELSQMLRRNVRCVVANPVDVARYTVEFFNLAKSVRDAQKSGLVNTQNNFEQLVELGRSGRNLDANDQHIVTIVDWLWQYAFDQRASDIHLEPRREMGVVRFRIDGVLHNVYQVPPSVLSAMISRIKLLGRMDVVEKRRPQDGRIKTRTAGAAEIELRLSTLPTAFGEKLVMRIFDPEVLLRDFNELGFADDELKRWNDMVSRPNGIVLVTGPTGSGKTTTLYTTLKQLATEQVNLCTVEDPIEMVEPSFNQMQVQTGIGVGFAEGVRALMRQDPDIIMVGEIRDLDTAEMAIQAALTGHLVMSTLHTNDSPSAISRLLDLGVPPYLLSATLIGVMAQRLVRSLCPHCKGVSEQINEDQWASLIKPFRARAPARLYHPVGCLECRMTGYRGRSGLYELLTMTDELRARITSDANLQAIRQQAMTDGMKPLRLAGANKVAAGITTVDEVLKNAPPAMG
jgi:general secretion pathway protein E